MDDDFGVLWIFVLVAWALLLLLITGVFDKEPEPSLVCPPGYSLLNYDTQDGPKQWCVLEERH